MCVCVCVRACVCVCISATDSCVHVFIYVSHKRTFDGVAGCRGWCKKGKVDQNDQIVHISTYVYLKPKPLEKTQVS